MHAVSDRFTATVSGPHRVATRAILVDSAPQFTTNPTGTDLEVISGSLTIASLTDVKQTLTLTVPGKYWDQVQPFGQEIYIQRGVEFANGDAEYVGLGYHRIEQIKQDNAPYGPIEITALDRIAQLQQNRQVFPVPLNNADSHRSVFERLVNGVSIPLQAQYPGLPTDGYGAYLGVRIPITWTSYDPDATTIIGDQLVDGDAYGYLANLIKFYRNSAMRFLNDGTLLVYSTVVDGSIPMATVYGGAGGTITTAKRVVKRADVHNVVTAYGNDPSSITSFISVFNADPASALAYNKTTYPAFGVAPTYYSSPLLQTDADVELAGEALLRRYRALPLVFTLTVIPNPALEPFDVVDVVMRPGLTPVRAIIDTVVIPLASDTPGSIVTRIPTATEGFGLGLGLLGA
jgi:uncharacterized protein DUF5047